VVALVIGSFFADFVSRLVHINRQKIHQVSTEKVHESAVELTGKDMKRAAIRKKYTTELNDSPNDKKHCKNTLKYSDYLLSLLPEKTWTCEIGAGCPFAAIPGAQEDLPKMFEGKIVVDMGCGAGIDCFLAARLGAEVYGLDMTQWMISKAAQDACTLGIDKHVSFLQQTIDEPLSEEVIWLLGRTDFVLTNGVINLCVKEKAFANAFALLKPGGWFFNADVILEDTSQAPT